MGEDDDTLRQAERRIGTVLGGKYRVDRVLGVGGMAVVYAATHRNRKKFAVKVLHEELSVRSDIRDRFLREGYVANSVDHPGVIVVLDDDVDSSGCAFLVMELLEGVGVDTLSEGMTKRLPVQVALSIAHQLLDVLEAAHAKEIVHRDIKPANLFVLADGGVKVLDFGIARLHDLTSGIKSTRAGALLGTPAFMAPEQAMAHGGEIDARTDLWAVGATLFTMTAGQFVHPGENGRQMLIRAATLPARSLRSVVPEVPDPVVDLVAKALEFEKDARWSSAASMRDEVARVREALFGSDGREALKSYVKTAHRAMETHPTEPSPLGSSDRGGPGENAGETLASVAPSDVATTTAKPISAPRSPTLPRPPPRRTLAVLGVTAAGLVAAVSLSLRHSPGAPAAQPLAAVRVNGADPSPPALAPPAPSPVQPATVAPPSPAPMTTSTASSAHGTGTLVKSPASIPLHAPASGPSSNASTAPAGPAKAASSAIHPGAAPPSNPLQIHLQ